MTKKKLHGTAKYLNQIYTIEGGSEKHGDKQQSIEVLKLTGVILARIRMKQLANKIENIEIKVLKRKE